MHEDQKRQQTRKDSAPHPQTAKSQVSRSIGLPIKRSMLRVAIRSWDRPAALKSGRSPPTTSNCPCADRRRPRPTNWYGLGREKFCRRNTVPSNQTRFTADQPSPALRAPRRPAVEGSFTQMICPQLVVFPALAHDREAEEAACHAAPSRTAAESSACQDSRVRLLVLRRSRPMYVIPLVVRPDPGFGAACW